MLETGSIFSTTTTNKEDREIWTSDVVFFSGTDVAILNCASLEYSTVCN